MGETAPLASHGAEVDSEVLEGTSFYHKYQAFFSEISDDFFSQTWYVVFVYCFLQN